MSNKREVESFEQSLRRTIEGAEVSPAPQMWSRIEASLDGATSISPLLLASRWVGAIAAAVAVAVGVNLWFIPSSDIEGYNSVLITEFEKMEGLPIALDPITLQEPRPRFVAAAVEEESPLEQISESKEEPQQGESRPTPQATEEKREEPEPLDAEARASTTPAQGEIQRDISEPRRLQRAQNRKPLNISMGYAGGNSTSTNSVASAYSSFNIMGTNSSDPQCIVLISNEGDTSAQSTHHQAPITAALSVAYGVSERWSIESGLSYSALNSTIEMPYTSESIRQKVELLGLPLRLNYDIYSTNNISLYVSAGGQIERVISSKLNSKDIYEKPWHLSTDGAVGVQYNINRWLGLYAEPEVRYFLTEMELSTIRSEHPVSFNLRFGLRFTFND